MASDEFRVAETPLYMRAVEASPSPPSLPTTGRSQYRGRPFIGPGGYPGARGGMSMMIRNDRDGEQINVKADGRMLAKLDRLAQRYGVSRQNVLRMLVAEAAE